MGFEPKDRSTLLFRVHAQNTHRWISVRHKYAQLKHYFFIYWCCTEISHTHRFGIFAAGAINATARGAETTHHKSISISKRPHARNSKTPLTSSTRCDSPLVAKAVGAIVSTAAAAAAVVVVVKQGHKHPPQPRPTKVGVAILSLARFPGCGRRCSCITVCHVFTDSRVFDQSLCALSLCRKTPL
jgi:hypothetical protein